MVYARACVITEPQPRSCLHRPQDPAQRYSLPSPCRQDVAHEVSKHRNSRASLKTGIKEESPPPRPGLPHRAVSSCVTGVEAQALASPRPLRRGGPVASVT